MPTIFVHVAAYRDPECQHTINDLFRKASNPDRISVGMVLQSMPEDDYCFHSSRVRAVHVDARESRGACWARSLGYTLYQGEDYVLQIDAHTRFAKHWDERLLAELAACASEKPMLTVYAPAYDPPNTLLDDFQRALHSCSFDVSGFVSQSVKVCLDPLLTPRPASLVSGHFMFARSQWIRDVPYDPHLYFWGEEITLAVRLWTSGWDLFSPRSGFVWHQYGRSKARRHWNDYNNWHAFNDQSYARMRYLLGMNGKCGSIACAEDIVDLDKYGLGRVRSLDDYERFSGIDFRQQTVSPSACSGVVPGAT